MALNGLGLGMTIGATDAASGVFKQVGGNFDRLRGQATKGAAMFDGVSSAVGSLGSKALMLAGTLGIGFGLHQAAMEANRFEKSVAKVASITDRAAFPMEKIESIVKDMAGTFGGDINLQADTLYQAVSSGATNAAEATALMNAANKLAIGGLSDSFKAVDAVTNVLNAYGMKMTEADKVSDAMFVTAKIGKTTIDELAGVIGHVAPTAAAMGVSMDDMMSVITGASTQLGNAAESVTGLKAALATLMHPTSDAAAEAARLGIKFDAAALKSKGFKGMIESITKSSKFNDQSLRKLFGNSLEAFNVISALTANGGKAFQDAAEGMKNKAGATSDAFDTMAKTADFASTVFKSNLQIAMVEVGKVIAPMLGAIVSKCNDLVKSFNGLSTESKQTAVKVGLVVVALATFGAQVGIVFGLGMALMAAFKRAADRDVGGFGTALKDAATKTKLFVDAVKQLFGQGGFSGDVRKAMNEAGNQGVREFAITLFLWFHRARNFVLSVRDSFVAAIDNMRAPFTRLIAAVNQLKELFAVSQDGPHRAKAKFAEWGAMGIKVGAALGKVFGMLINGISWTAEKIAYLVGVGAPLFEHLWQSVLYIWAAFKGFMADIAAGVGTGNNFSTTISLMATALGNVAKVTAAAWRVLAAFVTVGLSMAGGALRNWLGVFDGIVTYVQGFIKLIRGIFTGDWKMIWDGFSDIVFGAFKAIISAIGAAFAGIAGLIDGIGKVVGKDFGLKAKVQSEVDAFIKGGVGTPQATAAPVQPPPVTPAPSVAAAAVAPAAAPAAAPAGPTTVAAQVPVTLKIDSTAIAEALAKANISLANRQFAIPAPSF